MEVQTRIERLVARFLPGHCYFCLGTLDGTLPWCAACFEALALNEHACRYCAEPLPRHVRGPCGHCLKAPFAFERALVPFLYQDDMTMLLHRFKFHADMRAGRILMTLLLVALHAHAETLRHCVLVPVPLHPDRARERGFDQTAWLAKRLARQCRLPLHQARRTRATPSQRGLGRAERLGNVRDAFAFDGALPPHVMLFDDVMTTGATFEALARACQAAGARHVGVLALARTPHTVR